MALRAESLEERVVLSGESSLPVAPMWFGPGAVSVDTSPVVTAQHNPSDALSSSRASRDSSLPSQDWIVQLNRDAVHSFHSVSQALSLLENFTARFEVVRGLGQVGQILVRTFGASQTDVMDWLMLNPNVEGVEPDRPIRLSAVPNDPSYASLWGLENTGQSNGVVDADIDAATAWDLHVGNRSTIVAVIDTGIDYNHPDLAANVWSNLGEVPGDSLDNDGNGFIDDIHGWDFVNDDGDPMDDNNHGTHVAGTIGAVGGNSIGVVGVNWNVSLMALKIFDGSGNGSTSDAISAVNYATLMRERGENVRATSNSWGGGGFDAGLYNAISASRDQGILFVAAAGNSSRNNDVVAHYPSNFDLDNVISVAATDRLDALAGFSNYGVTSVDLSAPGVSIFSTTRGNTYASLSGTSMATPHVSGVVALAASLAPDANYQQIRSAILTSVDPLPSLSGKVVSGGRLSAAGTLNYLLNQATATPSEYLASATNYEAIDLVAGASGVLEILDGVGDASAPIDLNGNTFTYFGTTYTGVSALFVSSNGLISFGVANDSADNTQLIATPSSAVIAPFWDDLRTDMSAEDRVLARFDDLTGDSIADRLIIEWNEVGHFPSSASSVTFQVFLELNTAAVDGDIAFNYVDLDFGDTDSNNGRSATVGIKSTPSQGIDRLLISRNNGSNPLIGSGKAILLDRTRLGGDIVDVAPDPRQTSVSAVDVTFTEAIDSASFDYRDIALMRDGSAIVVTSDVAVTHVSGTTYRINGLSNLTGYDGSYVLSVNLKGVVDSVGHFGIELLTDAWLEDTPLTDLRMLSATANGTTQFAVTYEIANSPSTPFDIGIYRSNDTEFGGDTLLSTIAITAPADLTIGVHSKTWTIGTGTGKVALPGAGATEIDSDYYLLSVADPVGVVEEDDVGVPGEDNFTVFTGVYHPAAGQVFVHGTSAADSVGVSGSIVVTVNGVNYSYVNSDVAGLRVRTHGGADIVNAAALAKVIWAWSGAGNDTVTAGSNADFLAGGSGDDALAGNAGNDVLSGESGLDALIGGAGNDKYVFNSDVALGNDILDESGGGVDTLDFSTTASLGVTINLGLATAQVINANLTLTLGSVTAFENILGSDQNDALSGNAGANTLTGRMGDDMLSGGTGNDVYSFSANSILGSDTIVENAGAGSDLLDFSTTSTQAITVDLSSTNLQAVNSNLSLTFSSIDGIEHATGGALNDVLSGNALANSLSGGAGDDTLVGGGGNDVLVGGIGNDSLIGGSGNDSYSLGGNIALGNDTVVEMLGGGTDLLDFTTVTTLAVSIDLASNSLQVVHSNLSLTLSAGDVIENANGGALADVLVGNSLSNVLTGNSGNDSLSGGDGGDTLIGGNGNDTLTGGDGNDAYTFSANSALGSDTIVESSAGGIDKLDFSATTTQAVSVDLSQSTVQSVNGNLALALSAGDVIENLTGGSLTDMLSGNKLSNLIIGNAGNDSLNGGDGGDTLVGGAGNDTLLGGIGDDIYSFTANSALGTDAIVESAGAGTDLLDFSTTTSLAVTIDLASTSVQTVNANLSLALSAADGIENVAGGSLNDVLRGNSLANALMGNAGSDLFSGGEGDDTLIGGAGNDTYLYSADSSLGNDTLNESSGGIDTLDFSATTNYGIALDLGVASAQVVNPNLTIALGSSIAFENLIGSTQADTLAGNANSNILSGGSGNDTYMYAANSALGSDSLNESGGGIDTLDFSATDSFSIAINLGLATAQTVNANLVLNLGSATTFENVIGSLLGDTIIANISANTLIGGAGNDRYLFDADSSLGSDTIVELPGGGIDHVDFSFTTTLGVTIDLANSAAQTVNSNLALTLSNGDAIENVTGGSLDDLLTGNGLANTLTGGAGNDVLSGAGDNDVLVGGSGNDAYVFGADSALGSDTLNESGGGVDTLDFSPTAGLAVTVNLGLASGQTVSPNLILTLGSGSAFENIIGGDQNDTLTGNSLSNSLIGGAGDDALSGLGGRDLLVGGTGIDSLIGGDADDIVIAGTLLYYSESSKALNRPAVDAIMAEWNRAGVDYATRVANLRNGVGSGGSYKLDGDTVLTDTAEGDTLSGGNGLDWFWSFVGDVVVDLGNGGAETIN